MSTLGNPKDIMRLQKEGKLETLPAYPPGGTVREHATEQELIQRNRQQLSQLEASPAGQVAAERLAGRIPPPGHEGKIARAAVAESQPDPSMPYQVSGAHAPVVAPAAARGTQAPVADAAPAPEVSRSVAPGKASATVQEAVDADPMKHGGDASNLTGGKRSR